MSAQKEQLLSEELWPHEIFEGRQCCAFGDCSAIGEQGKKIVWIAVPVSIILPDYINVRITGDEEWHGP